MQILNTRRTLFSVKTFGLCILAIIVALSCSPLTAAYAVTSSEKYAEADEILQRIDALQTDLNQAQVSYDTAVTEHDAATEAMNDAQERVDAAEAHITDLQERLAGRASDMYRNGSTTILDVLLGANSFDEFLTSWDMIEKISSQDAQLVQETKDTREEAERARQEHSNQKAIAAEKMQQAQDLKTQISTTQESLRVEAQSITAEAMGLQVQEELEAEQARQAAAAAEAMQQQLANNNSLGDASPGSSGSSGGSDNSGSGSSGSTSSGGGSIGSNVVAGSGILSHPCPSGSVSSVFGWRSFDNSFHKGVDFAAPEGTPFYAAESGTVIYASYDGSYNGGAGNWVVIAHGNGMVTKYMHASSVQVGLYEQVSRGDNLGAVGNTGNSFGAHLHFQVEIKGVAVDPLQFL